MKTRHTQGSDIESGVRSKVYSMDCYAPSSGLLINYWEALHQEVSEEIPTDFMFDQQFPPVLSAFPRMIEGKLVEFMLLTREAPA